MIMSKFLQAADPLYKNAILSFPLTATDRLILEASVAKTYEIPSNTELLLFNSTIDICVLFGDSDVESYTPDEYDGDILDGTAPMLNPGLICGISFQDCTHVSIISSSEGAVYIQRWARR